MGEVLVIVCLILLAFALLPLVISTISWFLHLLVVVVFVVVVALVIHRFVRWANK